MPARSRRGGRSRAAAGQKGFALVNPSTALPNYKHILAQRYKHTACFQEADADADDADDADAAPSGNTDIQGHSHPGTQSFRNIGFQGHSLPGTQSSRDKGFHRQSLGTISIQRHSFSGTQPFVGSPRSLWSQYEFQPNGYVHLTTY